LAHSKSALKRWRQNEAHRERNKPVRTAARTAVRKARTAIQDGDEAEAAIREATRVLDKAAKRNIIHKNTAARQKSRLMRRLNKASAGPATAEAPKKTRLRAAKAPAKKATAKKTAATAKPRKAAAKKTSS
jgi:small subunit ribosomal protein S20